MTSKRTILHRRHREKVTCDRCGATFREGDLLEQDGILVCRKRCLDEPDRDDYEERGGR